MEIKTAVGLRIKELRTKKKVTQEVLALSSGLDRTYINSVENGNRNISIINIEKITKSLDVSLSQFFKSELFDRK